MSFIKSVLLNLKSKNYSLDKVHFVLPSKRAATHLKMCLSEIINFPIFAPNITTIKTFAEQMSGLKQLNNTQLLFELYDAYRLNTPKLEQENFEFFFKWGQLLLQDFNDIDQHLINEIEVFNYLRAIKNIDHWYSQESKSKLISSYLKFWHRLHKYYNTYVTQLKKEGYGYQGLIYRQAAQNLEGFIAKNCNQKYIFLGFNALNGSQNLIIKEMLANGIAEIFWDIDKYFLENQTHSAGYFVRQYKSSWKYYRSHPFNNISTHYCNKKNISVIAVPYRVGQAKYIGNLLNEIKIKNNLSKTAVILSNETLLLPLLNSIPNEVSNINVTMGLSLQSIPLATLFECLLECHKGTKEKIYFKNVLKVINHPSVNALFENNNTNYAAVITNHIHTNNLIYLTVSDLHNIAKPHRSLISLLFEDWDSTNNILSKCEALLFEIKKVLTESKKKNSLELEYLYRFYKLFKQVKILNGTYKHIKSINSFLSVYRALLNTEKLYFKGEPLEGLQIMGMLESRVLDFETVIISDVNEGILPAGKTQNSFIPFDVKIQNGMPTYKEKDAIYTYHFYRLIQRAKNVHILYNTEADTLKGGEKSRFITQLEVEGIHKIKHQFAVPDIKPLSKKLITIRKSKKLCLKLKEIANKGFSPSSLINYIRNPVDFYYEKVLNLKVFEEAEEYIARNTFGSAIHKTLEEFYKPLEGTNLTTENLQQLIPKIECTVSKQLKNKYHKGDFTKGKNLILFEIAKRHIYNFITHEINDLKKGNQIKIIAIEINEIIDIPIKNIDFDVKLKGQIDRLDQWNGTTRIIDYKTGEVTLSNLEITDWEPLITDYKKYSKTFQVLSYTYMLHKKKKITLPVEAGIFSFKNLNSGFIKFAKKESIRGIKTHAITIETLTIFENHLIKLITEICNPSIDFTEKEIK